MESKKDQQPGLWDQEAVVGFVEMWPNFREKIWGEMFASLLILSDSRKMCPGGGFGIPQDAELGKQCPFYFLP